MNFKLLAALAAISPEATSAASVVTQLDVLGEAVTFTLEQPKSHAIPGCVSADNQQKWAINLNSLQGQAMYSLLVTAISKEHLVNVTSANRCEAIADIEQAGSVSLQTNPNVQSGLGVSLYKGDGVTRIGTVTSTDNGIHYAPVNGSYRIQNYALSVLNATYYLDEQCQGQGYVNHTGHHSPYLIESKGKYYLKSDSSKHENLLSINGAKPVYELRVHYINGLQCTKARYTADQYDNRYTKLIEAEHPLCGWRACVIK
ncbi:hypothetical protein [Pseudoalteromonas rubra]|uniref:hypothetical protein n=1 Tax=Pseudoalteromonas rubra TaxID=43658 RepID=UPI000F77F4E2|nr:hypothetical protein [Pseudoalteromonas rubra]